MEEILASIRKIISEDSPESSEPAHEPEVLDLTQEVKDESAPDSSAHPMASQSTDPEEAMASEPTHIHEPTGDASVSDEVNMHSSEGIFSEKARKALSDVFNGLAPSQPAEIAPVHGLSVETVFEGAVRDAFEPVLQKWLSENAGTIIERMKPAISDWLDEHFPAMLEDAVRNEVARAVKARGRR
jgi:hypothetical protein